MFMILTRPTLCSIQVAVDYLGERTTFTPEQLMAMLMVDEKAIAETDGSPVTDCVIAIPAYFSAEERRAMLDASQIAGINCLRLMPETTATALAFGIYKTDLPEKDPLNVVFVDVGYSCLQVSTHRASSLHLLVHKSDRQCIYFNQGERLWSGRMFHRNWLLLKLSSPQNPAIAEPCWILFHMTS